MRKSIVITFVKLVYYEKIKILIPWSILTNPKFIFKKTRPVSIHHPERKTGTNDFS